MSLHEFRGWLLGYARQFPRPGQPTWKQWLRIMRESAQVRAGRGVSVSVDFNDVGLPILSTHTAREVLL